MSILRSAILTLILSAALASAIAFLAWTLLPYELLERESLADRFAFWEGAMWAIGLASLLFGAAAAFGSTDLYTDRSVEHVQRTVRDGVRGRLEFSELPRIPWIMSVCGISMLLLATLVRSIMLG